MPSCTGGDQMSEEYAPHLYRKEPAIANSDETLGAKGPNGPSCPSGDCGEERAVIDVTTAREYADMMDRAQERAIGQSVIVIDGAKTIIRRLCDELEVRTRHLGRLQDGLERLENRCSHLINDALPECQVLDVREIRQLIQGARRGP